MELEGRVWKGGSDSGWLIEVPYLNVMTQGNTKEEALEMIVDAVQLLMEDAYEGKKFNLKVNYYGKDLFGLSCKQDNYLLAFALRRQREMNRLTIREAARRLGSNSPNAYARYERALVKPTIQKYEQLLQAVNPKRYGLLIR